MTEIKDYLTPPDLRKVLNMSLPGIYHLLERNNIQTIPFGSRKKIHPLEFRKVMEERGYRYPNQNISFQIVKGGCGKTSLSYGLGLRASLYGARVLIIDLDLQANLTRSFNIRAKGKPIFIDILKNGVPINDTIIKVSDTLDIIPSNLNTSRIDLELAHIDFNPKYYLRDIIKPIRDKYDIVILDCPPAVNKINVMATGASDLVLIPIYPDSYVFDGICLTLSEMEHVTKIFDIHVDYKIIWNQYDAREKLTVEIMQDLKEANLEDRIVPSIIRVDKNLANSIYQGIPLFQLTRKSTIQQDIDDFTREIMGIKAWSLRQQ